MVDRPDRRSHVGIALEELVDRLLAAEDRSAPNEQTIAKLETLIASAKPYTLTVFPNADHGMVTFTRQGNEFTYTGYVPDYFREEVNALKRLSASGTGN